jgi:secretion/DNA translocation related TadE-like protein
MPWRAERGSASIVAVGLLCVLVIAITAAVAVCALLAAKQRVSAAADAAALAAADAASGRVAGFPCDRAAHAARLNDAELLSCTVDGATATVGARLTVAGIPITVLARAGPRPNP